MSYLEKAIKLAVLSHEGQLDKAGSPYILHPLRMMFRFQNEALQMVAVLHDVVEDTEVSLEQLQEEGYPEEVITGVQAMTRRDDESYDEFIERAASNALARQVKKADLEDNMDVLRLKNIGPKDFERLARYRKSWHKLT